jgi:two-component system cell cycle sensor histidine kinase/response regulator CckA
MHDERPPETLSDPANRHPRTDELDVEVLRQIVENVREVVWMSAANGAILYVSPGYERIWGRSVAELYAHPTDWLDAIHPDDRHRIVPPAVDSIAAREWDVEYRIARPDGSIRWIHDRAFPVRDAQGHVYRIAGLAEDVTERRRTAEHLRQTQKMEAIGQLAGGVAHDFNNILAAMMMQLEMAAAPEHLPEDTQTGLAEARASAERAAALTKQLLLFGRREVVSTSRLDLNDRLWSTSNMLRRLLGDRVRIDLQLDAKPLPVSADPNLIDQLLVNLAVNARDAMASGGDLVVETGILTVTEAGLAASPDAVPGHYARLTVRDSGSGIPEEDLPHIFEPFFTTKPTGQGTGLGLSTVMGITKQHGGWIEVTSAVGAGSSFDIYIPLLGEPEDRDAAMVPTTASLGGRETILLVEDELFVRRSAKRVLERQGYRVIEATDAADAIRMWESNLYAIDLLLTDIEMPGGVSGVALARTLRAQRADLKVLLTSGHSQEWPGQQPDATEVFLPKPSSSQHLLEAVRRCLDA